MCPAPQARGPATGSGVSPGEHGPPLRTLRCMLGMLTGVLLVAAFIAVAGASLVVLLRLFRIARPGRGEARTGG